MEQINLTQDFQPSGVAKTRSNQYVVNTATETAGDVPDSNFYLILDIPG